MWHKQERYKTNATQGAKAHLARYEDSDDDDDNDDDDDDDDLDSEYVINEKY